VTGVYIGDYADNAALALTCRVCGSLIFVGELYVGLNGEPKEHYYNCGADDA
jgi:hypothetical protein